VNSLLPTLIDETFTALNQLGNCVERHCDFPLADDVIKVAIGMRRVGKTYFLYQTINQLLDGGVAEEQILLINFEDDRLLPMTAKEMGALLDDFYTLYPENHDRCCYLFLDEVQNVPDWHLVVRRFFDSKNVQLYLTGSSAKLLSKEIASSLRGRSLATEIWPYDFSEFLSANDRTLPNKPLSKRDYDFLQENLLNYFILGGFPGVQDLIEREWRATLQTYVDTVILRDIIERYNVSNIKLLKYLTNTLLKNAATKFSINKFYNDVKSQGHKIGKDTLHNYMEYLEDAFLVFTVPFYAESERVKQNRTKKIYAIDTGLINAMALSVNDLYNKCFENLIYLDLRRAGKQVYYYETKAGYEVDFVAVSSDGTRELIQVTWDMSDATTAEREQRALDSAEAELGLKGRIITPQAYLAALVERG
tara:strand:+ start:9280 stop:10539 length:1260 start_codon:yes stop_codon:yes gene_type:complete